MVNTCTYESRIYDEKGPSLQYMVLRKLDNHTQKSEIEPYFMLLSKLTWDIEDLNIISENIRKKLLNIGIGIIFPADVQSTNNKRQN